MKLKACFLAGLAFCLASLALALDFPPLTGRVVDQANIMTAQSRTDLEAKLKELNPYRAATLKPTPTTFSDPGSLAKQRKTMVYCS